MYYYIIMKAINEFIINNRDLFFQKALEKNLDDCESVLDVGCGEESFIKRVKEVLHFYSEGIDIFKLAITKSKKRKIHNKHTLGDIRKINVFYKPKSFDAVIALDVVEHLEKEDAFKLIKNMEKIAKKKVIILTPNDFEHQHIHNDNPYQIHKSAWTKKEFQEQNYKVHGFRGLKFLRGGFASIKWKPWIFWGAISFASEPILYFFPNLSYQFLAVKKLNYKK